jgi:hypothetical protein
MSSSGIEQKSQSPGGVRRGSPGIRREFPLTLRVEPETSPESEPKPGAQHHHKTHLRVSYRGGKPRHLPNNRLG